MGDYINSPSLSNHEDPRKTEKESSDSAVPCGAIHGHTAPNATADWAVEDLVEMRYLLIGQKRQLEGDHDDLEARYRNCSLKLRGSPSFDRHPPIEYYDEELDQRRADRHVIKDLERQRSRLQIKLQKL
ncbi:hypothetical protein NHX12_001744, partial [Muraenolepis orangiensis]